MNHADMLTGLFWLVAIAGMFLAGILSDALDRHIDRRTLPQTDAARADLYARDAEAERGRV